MRFWSQHAGPRCSVCRKPVKGDHNAASCLKGKQGKRKGQGAGPGPGNASGRALAQPGSQPTGPATDAGSADDTDVGPSMMKFAAVMKGRSLGERLRAAAPTIHALLKSNGGYTGSVPNGTPVVTGFAVNRAGKHVFLKPHPSVEEFTEALAAAAEWLSSDGNEFFGVWHDEELSRTVIGKVVVVSDRHEAAVLSGDNNQRYFCHLDTGCTLPSAP